MARKVDLVGVIERIYQPAETLQAWHLEVVRAVRGLIDPEGHGIGSHTFDVRDPMKPRIEEIALEDMAIPPAVLAEAYRDVPRELVVRLYDGPAVSSLSSRGVDQAPVDAGIYSRRRFADAVALRIDDEPFVGWTMFAPRSRRTTIPFAERTALERIGRHIAAGTRLARAQANRASPDAIVSPSGKVEHATAGARDAASREALRTATRRIEKARGPMRRLAPREAIAEWRALVDGRWSLVDHFDHDGRRYLYAIRNAPTTRPIPRLSAREAEVCALAALGHANKLVAYELGLSISTVAGYLATAMVKLGVRTRVELIARWNAVPRSSKSRPSK